MEARQMHERVAPPLPEEDPRAAADVRCPRSSSNGCRSNRSFLRGLLALSTLAVAVVVWLGTTYAMNMGQKDGIEIVLSSSSTQEVSHIAPLVNSSSPHRRGHIAICFFGQVKNFSAVLPSLEEFVFAPLRAQGLTYECFAHTYNIEQITNSRNGEFNAPTHPDSIIQLRRSCAPAPVTLKFTAPEEVDQRHSLSEYFLPGHPWNASNMTQISFIRQLASLKFVTQMRQRHGADFEYALYLRPDTRFFTPLHVNTSMSETDVVTPDFHEWGGRNDRMAYGRIQAMDIYGMRFDYIPMFWRLHPTLHLLAENYLATVLEDHHLQAQLTHVRFARVRANGMMNPLDAQLCAVLNQRHHSRSSRIVKSV